MQPRVLLLLEATGGGAGRHVVDLSLGLWRRGIEVHLAYSPLRMDVVFAQHLSLLQKTGISLLHVPIHRRPHPTDIAVLEKLYAYAKKHGPFDIVHGHSSKAGALARLLGSLIGAKTVYTPHSIISLRGPSVYNLAERALAPFTDLAIAVSPWERDALQRLGYKRVEVVLNGIDPKGFPSREEARRVLGLKGEKVVGFVGRFSDQKDPLLALRTFARIKDSQLRLVMVGDGPLRAEVEKESEKLGIGERILLLGTREAREVFPAFDLLLLTSRYEGFPYVVLEAFALSIPIVSAPTPGLGEWLRKHGALVAEKADSDALSSALEKALLAYSQPPPWDQEWTLERMVEKTLELYQAIL